MYGVKEKKEKTVDLFISMSTRCTVKPGKYPMIKTTLLLQ